jgi:hypothetical protein
LLDDLPAGALLSVNLSGPLLLDPRTSELLLGTPHLDRLILEVTENSLLEETPGLAAEISRLIGEGIKFAVDDMGAGYSGLRQITSVRPSYLKLDRCAQGRDDRLVAEMADELDATSTALPVYSRPGSRAESSGPNARWPIVAVSPAGSSRLAAASRRSVPPWASNNASVTASRSRRRSSGDSRSR